jgi:hypothetical protein
MSPCCPAEEILYLVLLGDPVEPELATHIAACADCQRRTTRLRSTVGLLQTGLAAAAANLATPSGPPRQAERARPARIGKYLVVGTLERGDEATLYRAVPPGLATDVALLWWHRALPAGAEQHVRDEKRRLGEIDHPHLVRILDVNVAEGRPFLVMPYVRGLTLEQYAQQHAPAPRQAASMVFMLASAVAAAHEHGISHQDITPDSVLIDELGLPHLTALGSASLRRLCNGTADALPGDDVFALGSLLYFLLTGQAVQGVPNLSALAARPIPGRLAAICRKALAVEPDQRYAQVKALALALEGFVERRPPLLRRVAVGLGLFVLAAVLFVALGNFRSPERPVVAPVAVAPADAPQVEPGEALDSGTTPEEEALVAAVMERLLSSPQVQAGYPRHYAWPPRCVIKPQSAQEQIAYASAQPWLGARIEPRSQRTQPALLITQGYLRHIVQGNADVLAAILGHELAHLLRGHVEKLPVAADGALPAFERVQEIEADREGMRYALAAGYAYRPGIDSLLRALQQAKLPSFEGLPGNGLSDAERRTLLDREQMQLWRAMPAYQHGVYFLHSEQYPLAALCFAAVTLEFPDSAETEAYRGHALLMHYCDGLGSGALRHYDIGQVVAAAFYPRPAELEPSRGKDAPLWREAVAVLESAHQRDPHLILPPARLGLAYLFHPDAPDPARAIAHFRTALELLDKERRLDDHAAAAVWLNAGVADAAAGNAAAAEAKFARAARIVQGTPPIGTLEDALLYNRARLAAPRREAFPLLERYLRQADPASAWWERAYELYAQLGRDLEMPVQPRADLARRAAETVAPSIRLSDGRDIALSEFTHAVEQRLGRPLGVRVPIYPGATLARWRQVRSGIDLLAAHRIQAICLTSPDAPAVRLEGKAAELCVGMTEQELAALLPGQRAEADPRSLDEPSSAYRFYPALGLALRLAEGRVAELVLAPLPRRISPAP